MTFLLDPCAQGELVLEGEEYRQAGSLNLGHRDQDAHELTRYMHATTESSNQFYYPKSEAKSFDDNIRKLNASIRRFSLFKQT